MKQILKITTLFLFLACLWGCQDTKLGDIDLDFDISLDSKEVKTYVGKPIKIAVSVNLDDPKNNYPFETKVKYANGTLKANSETKNSEETFSFDYKTKGTLYLEFVPTKTGKQDITIYIKNELVNKMIICTVDCTDALYEIEIKDAPIRPLIDTKFDFSLLVKEAEATGADSIVAYAKVVKGSGFVYSGEQLINEGLNDTAKVKAAKTTPLVIGKNNISYQSTKEGENVIRFYFTNKYGYETYQDVTTNIHLPEWTLTDSENGKMVDVPFQDNYSFTLNLVEKDIFKDNSYEGFFRVLSNTDLTLKINDKSYTQGATIPLKAGGNVGILNVQATGEGAIEFIVKDKYKQQNKDTLRFTSKLPLKPIEASLDKSSQSVKINQIATFKLTLNEQNYSDIFTVKYQITSGTGTFEGGTTQNLSAGTHTLKYTPTASGSHTFKITVTDKNNQTKELSATVQASLSPMAATLSSTTLNLIQGEKGSTTLTVSEADYTGKFYLKYTASGTAGRIDVGTVNLGVGGVAHFEVNTMNISVTPSVLGTTTYNFVIEDDYHQIKELPVKVVTKGKVTATAGTGGDVSGGGNFDLNQSCTLKATPNTGYSFLGWYKNGNLVSNQATYTFNVTESISLEARFSTNSYTISATAEAGGSATGGGVVEHGKTTTLKATVNTGYTFAGWYEGATKVSSALEYTITVTSNKTLVAKFTPNSYNITVNATVGGTVTGGATYKHNETATLKATANTGYAFTGWYLGGTKVSDSPTYNITVTGAATYEAKFSANSYAITVNAQEGGTVSGGGNYNYNDNVSVKAVADANYDFLGWYEAGTQVSTSLTYNFTISKARTLEARFKVKQYTLSVSATTGGTVTGGGTYDFNSNVTLTAVTLTGYTFTGWYEGSNKLGTNLTYIAKVTGNRTIEARFEANKLNVVVNATTGGTVSGSGSYSYNTNATVTAVVNANYSFVGWYDGATQVSTSLSYTFKVTKETTLTAKFIVNKHTVTVTGAGTQTGAGSYDWNTNATVKATAPANQEFVGWYEGSTQVSTSNPYTFAVTKDRILEAKYKLVQYTVTVNALTGGTATGGGTFNTGTEVTLKAIPSTGYNFLGWYNGTNLVSNSTEYKFSVTKDIVLEARFSADSYTVSATAETGGSIIGAGTYEYGKNCILKATVNTGYTFDGWYEGATKVSSALEYTFTVTANKTLVAKFSANKYNITANATTGGSVTGGGTHEHNSTATLKATANTGYAFTGWYLGGTKVSDSPTYTFTVTAAGTYEAKFSANSYAITVNAQEGGTVSGGGNYNYNDNVSVKAVADANYDFLGWYEAGTQVSTSLTYNFTVTKARTLEARFKVKQYTLSVSATTGGTVTGGGTYDFNSNVTLTAVTLTGYAFTGWYEGSNKLGTNLTYIAKVTGNRTIEARFEANKFNVVVNATTGGTVSGNGSYSYNTNATVTAVVNANYSFVGWYDGATQVSTSLSYTFKVTKETTLTAKFIVNKHTVTVTGAGTQTGAGSYDWNTNATVKATAPANQEFVGWYEGSTQVSTSNPYTFAVTKDRILEAKYQLVKYTLSVVAETGGTVTGGATVEHGKTATVKATPNANYTFAGWYNGATRISTDATYVVTVTGNTTLVAKFTANKFNVTVNAQAGGTVTGGGSFDYNSSVTVKATLLPNYTFAGWYNGSTKVSDATTYTFTLTGAVTLEARFTPTKFSVTVNALTGGTASGSGSFDYNSNVTVTAVVGTGYTFDGWYNSTTKVSASLSYTFVLTGNIALTAKFTAKEFTIIVNAGTGGTATGGGSAAYDTNKTVTATPSTGYAFSGWYEGSSQVSTTASYTFKVEKDRTLEARFTANKYNIVVNAATGGTASGSASVSYGTNTTVTASPSTGYDFEGWYNGSTKVSSNATYTFTVTGALTLEARFVVKKFTVTLSGTNGTQTGAGSYNYNTNATLKATPSTGYQLTGWYEGATQLSTSNPYTFAVTKDRIIEAKYQLVKYTVTPVTSTGGTVTGGGSIEHGKNATITASPSTGYIFDGWYNGSTKVSSSASYTFVVTSNISLTAKFTSNQYVLTVSGTTGGSVSGSGSFNHGDNVIVIATPDRGYVFDGWYEGGTKVSSSATYNFTITKARTLDAKFKISEETASWIFNNGGSVKTVTYKKFYKVGEVIKFKHKESGVINGLYIAFAINNNWTDNPSWLKISETEYEYTISARNTPQIIRLYGAGDIILFSFEIIK